MNSLPLSEPIPAISKKNKDFMFILGKIHNLHKYAQYLNMIKFKIINAQKSGF